MFESFKKASDDYGYLLEQIVRFNQCKICVEIGVAFGTTTNYLCKGSKSHNGHVYGFDLWETHGLWNQFGPLSNLADVNKFLTSQGHSNFTLTKINTKEPEFKDIINNLPTIDFAFIDGCHSYDGVKNDFDIIYPKLSSKCGIIVFHDTAVIDGCREFMIDLKKMQNPEINIVDFPYGGTRRFGLSVLTKNDYSHGVEIDEVCGSPSNPSEIYLKEQAFIKL